MTADKTSPASIPPAKKIKKRKKITTKIYHLPSIYSSVLEPYFPVTSDEQLPADFRKTCYLHGHC